MSAILGSLAILSLAIPRIWSAFSLLPGMAAIELIENGVRPGDAGIIRAIDAQTAALRVMARPEPHMDTAYLAQALAEAAGSAEATLPISSRSPGITSSGAHPGARASARLVDARGLAVARR